MNAVEKLQKRNPVCRNLCKYFNLSVKKVEIRGQEG